MNILILDDRLIRHQAFERTLVGNELFHALSAPEAVELLKKHRFEAAFLDYNLGHRVPNNPPENNGLTVAIWMGNDPDRCPSKIFIHSTNKKWREAMLLELPYAYNIPKCWIWEKRIQDGKDLLYAD